MATKAKQWKKSKVVEPLDMELPSGNEAKVKAPGMETFIQLGMVPNSLLGMIRKLTEANNGNAAKTKGTEDKVMSDLLKDPEKLEALFTMVDGIVVYCMVEPEVQPNPAKDEEGNEVEERDPELLYVDEMDLNDKMFIMNFAMGGTRAVEQFREEVTGVLEPGHSGKEPIKKTKRTGGSKKKSGSKKR